MNTEFFANWMRQARKGLLELAILNDIGHHGMYGYEIEKRFGRSQGLLLGGGTVYAILGRFRTGGLVKVVEARSPDGPRRKYYELTRSGQEMLVQMNTYWKALGGQIAAIAKSRPDFSDSRRRCHRG
jgi:PadR family transcriptional regulator PadR